MFRLYRESPGCYAVAIMSEKKKLGRPPGEPKTSKTFRIPDRLIRSGKRVTDWTPNTFTDLVEKGLERQIRYELAEYKKRTGVDMPGEDDEP